MKKKFCITSFGNLIVGRAFRYNREWCQKLDVLSFTDSHSYKHPAPKLYTLVVTEPENCLTR